MGAEVVKAAAIRFELGFDVELVDDEDMSDDDTARPPEDRVQRSIVWGEGVAATDGNSAQKLHEVRREACALIQFFYLAAWCVFGEPGMAWMAWVLSCTLIAGLGEITI